MLDTYKVCIFLSIITLICDYRFERYIKYEEPVEVILYEQEQNARLALLDNLHRQTPRFYQSLYISIPITNISGN